MECILYLACTGCFLVPLFTVVCLVLALLPRTNPEVLSIRIAHFGLFLGFFLAIGAIFNGLWSCLVFNRLYYSADYCVDFFPFWPITKAMIERPFGSEQGKLFGDSLLQLQLVWLLFALGTWGVTILFYRPFSRLFGREQAILIRLSRLMAVILFPCSLLIAGGVWSFVYPHLKFPAWGACTLCLVFITVGMAVPGFITRRMMRQFKAHHPVEPVPVPSVPPS